MLRNRALSLPFAAGLLALAPLAAQAPLVGSDQIIGWVNPGATTLAGALDQQDVLNRCPPARRVCKSVLARSKVTYAGGTGYDPRHQSAWVSDGAMIAEYLLGRGACRVSCRILASKSSRVASVSGLALADHGSRLFHLETSPGAYGIVAYDNRKCPPRVFARCKGSLGNTRALATGLAYDEIQGVLYMSVSFPGILGWSSSVWVLKPPSASGLCARICAFPILAGCSSRMSTGLAFDACRRTLYATDGRVTQAVTVGSLASGRCATKLIACCKKQLAGDFKGLAVVPGWKTRAVGKSCTDLRVCGSCPNMRASISGGDPSLGNPDFRFDLANGPTPAFAIPMFNLGACTGGISAPGLCGPIFPKPPAIVLPISFPMLGLGCVGKASLRTGIPVDRGLCGKLVCGQWIVVCVKGGNLGLGLSNAVEMSFAGS